MNTLTGVCAFLPFSVSDPAVQENLDWILKTPTPVVLATILMNQQKIMALLNRKDAYKTKKVDASHLGFPLNSKNDLEAIEKRLQEDAVFSRSIHFWCSWAFSCIPPE